MITIYKPQIETVDNNVKLKCRIIDEAQAIDKELWYEVNNEYAKYLCPEVCDGFILAMLLPAVVKAIYAEKADTLSYILEPIVGKVDAEASQSGVVEEKVYAWLKSVGVPNKLKDEGKKVLLIAADTFRAGATAQLKEWSERIGVGFYGKSEGADPASVVFDGLVKAKDESYDVVLIDTAGRLQNKVNLMKELEKINKVIDGQIDGGASETLLVIDATTGQNGISQAKAFKEITNITGIVLTKLDGTAKGGIVLAIKENIGVPVKYIGLGETKEDLQVFDIEKYIYGLFKDFM